MAVWTSNNTSGLYDPYGGQRYYEEQERRYREAIDRQRYEAMRQQQAYDPYRQMQGQVTDQQIQEGKAEKPTTKKAEGFPPPEYLNNKNLLLLD
jgi:hypothetical protein